MLEGWEWGWREKLEEELLLGGEKKGRFGGLGGRRELR